MRRFVWELERALDPADYMQWLDDHGSDLPPGARAYAAHPSHFDYYAFRVGDELLDPGTPLCPKDLLLQSASWSGEKDTLVLELMFPGYDPALVGAFDLTIVYSDVRRFSLEHQPCTPLRVPIQLGGLMSDEVAPDHAGFVHYIDFECGSVTVVGSDLTATWR
jgi:hypothetical protein